MKATLTFDDPRWDIPATEQRLGSQLVVESKTVKTKIKEKHLSGGDRPASRIIRRRGLGFTHGHKVSIRGNPPSPDTLTLLNAVDDQATGTLQREVYVKPNQNPRGGVADEYGAILDNPNKLNRPWFETTVEEYRPEFVKNMATALERK